MPDPVNLADCTCANLRQATRVITQIYEAALKPSGLTPMQFTILANLAGRGALTMTGLAEALKMDRTSLTRTLRALLLDDAVRIEPARDKRIRTVALTATGRERFAAAKPLWEEAQRGVHERLGKETWQGLLVHLQQAATLEHG